MLLWNQFCEDIFVKSFVKIGKHFLPYRMNKNKAQVFLFNFFFS